jgi:hypothetical protein
MSPEAAVRCRDHASGGLPRQGRTKLLHRRNGRKNCTPDPAERRDLLLASRAAVGMIATF